MKFGENLKNLRKISKLSQEQLAEKMNVSRQSVSKWETGEAYPEMNNILELCHIFHCNINDLVNDNILDVDSLGEDIKKNAVKLKAKEQQKMKGLSKAIAVIARIGKIISIVAIPILVVSMIITLFVASRLEIKDNKMIWNNANESITVVETEEQISVEFNGNIIAKINSAYELEMVKDLLQNNSKEAILFYIETGFLFLIVVLVLTSILLSSLEKLFTNINQGDTPFTLENVRHIKKMAYLMIAITILPNMIGALFEMFLRTDLNIEFEMFSLVEILVLFSIAYIFEYGYEIQRDSKGKMYGEINE